MAGNALRLKEPKISCASSDDFSVVAKRFLFTHAYSSHLSDEHFHPKAPILL
jgi:hypothetical protein